RLFLAVGADLDGLIGFLDEQADGRSFLALLRVLRLLLLGRDLVAAESGCAQGDAGEDETDCELGEQVLRHRRFSGLANETIMNTSRGAGRRVWGGGQGGPRGRCCREYGRPHLKARTNGCR